MYKIYADDELIYDSTLEDYKIGKGQITREVDKSGSFVFSVYPEHPYYDKFIKLKTVITVYKFGSIVFRGRILNDVTDYYNNKVINCEGELGFLQDSIIRPFEFSGSPAEFFRKIIEEHNAQVNEFKQFKIGEITVTDPNNTVTRWSTTYQTAYDSITKRLTESGLSGHIFITHGDDGKEKIPTINYLADFTNTASQTIEFGENLKNYTKTAKAEDIATAIIPLGATIETETKNETENEDDNGNNYPGKRPSNYYTSSAWYDKLSKLFPHIFPPREEEPEEEDTENEDSYDETEKPKVTIASVNDGVDFVYSQEAVDHYGLIFKIVEWQDVTEPENLLRKAKEYLESVINQNITIELNAIDLHLLDRNIASFNVCDYVKVRSEPHNFEATLLCNKQTLDLLKPENDSVVLGQTYGYFTRENNKLSNSVGSITTKIENQITQINNTINTISVQVIESQNIDIEPNIYQVFGVVDSLAVNLVPANNNLINEYCFEFIPSENFTELTITPEPKWANAPQYPPGKTCQVSIVRDVGVFVCA